MAVADKGIAISTISMPKLSTLLNDFTIKTVNHLNKLSVNVDEKLHEFDKKIQDLEIMTTLLEAKINSLPPEIVAQYPQLTICKLDDVNPVLTSPAVIQIIPEQHPQQQQQQQPQQQPDQANNNPQPEVVAEPVKEEPVELSPQEKLDKFLEENNSESYLNLTKMLKFKIPEQSILQKAQFGGLDMNIVTQLLELYKKAHPY